MGLKEQNWEKAEVSARVIDRRGPAIECTSAQAPKTRNEHTYSRARKKRIDRSAIEREAQVNRSPILESFILLGFC
jgi:hypothetical protein